MRTPATARAGRWRLVGAVLLVLLPLAALAQPADMAERLAACAACHGKLGEGVSGAQYQPHLAGKPAGYLYAQLRHFRDGQRVDAQMTWLLRNMDDAWLRQIAGFYAAQPPRTRPADNGEALTPAMRETAERLVAHGDPARGVPACAACHGTTLTGLAPGIPALVGLPAEYIYAQLGNWRSGVRQADAPDCMAEIARSLDAADLRAISVWLSHQVAPADSGPAPAGSFVPPRACGSLPHAEPAP